MKSTRASVASYNIYDFDHTVYDGDCSLDFYLYCVRKCPRILGYAPLQWWHLLRLITKHEDRTSFKGHFFAFLRALNDVDALVESFWRTHEKKLKVWYRHTEHGRDIIISASPEFLLRPICRRLKIYLLIGTRLDPISGLIDGQNCRGEEKVERLKQALGEPIIDKVYTDSLVDLPLLALAKEQYIVKGNEVLTLQAYVHNKPRRATPELPDILG